jgi:ornithine cyclodeaminase
VLAPPALTCIGILGTGTQARRQAIWLSRVSPCRRIVVWGRRPERAEALAEELRGVGFAVATAGQPAEVAAEAELLVTTTASHQPLLRARDVRPGTHVTAVGSDTADKQELEEALLGRADLVVADSRAQCQERGEIAHALRAGTLQLEDVVEIGELLEAADPIPRSPSAITIADLTGVAVQDLAAAAAVLASLRSAEIVE